jgi:hypothetical protein
MEEPVEEDDVFCLSLGRTVIQTFKNYISQELRNTTTKKGRNTGHVSLNIAPFPEILFDHWFLTPARLSKDWKVNTSDDKTSIKVPSSYEQLDAIFGTWRRIDVVLDDNVDDGWYEVNIKLPLTLLYTKSKQQLKILYRVTRKNRHGNFQFT